LLGTGSSGRGEHGASLDASRLLFSLRKEVSEFFNLQNPLGVVFTAILQEALILQFRVC
jgi:selenocysteine lyase/cysteine desulfurase